MKILSVIVFLLTISACSIKRDDIKAPIRLSNIPEKAFWVGGTDGGNWFYVEDVHKHGNNAIIKIYNDNDGSLIVSKKFILVCPADNQMFIEDLQKQINAFDGERILLESKNDKKACFLQ